MAIFRFEAKIVKRSAGRSATAAAAYRAATFIADERSGLGFNYSRKRGVLHCEIIAPASAPGWVRDRARLWNAVELSERRKDAQLARDLVLCLPFELTHEQRVELVREFVGEVFVARGMVADIAIHAPDHRGDDRNHHAHVRVQAEVDRMQAEGRLPEPASTDFILWLHREFYRDAPEEMLRIRGANHEFLMEPGAWRSRAEHDVAVGRHQPPSSDRVADFMDYYADRYRFDRMGKAARIVAIPAAHHRFNYIHPFSDGNGRVSRLVSHAMAHAAGIGAHGLWSVSRGLARGLESRGDYKRMMDHADTPRQGDLDGRGNLSQRALTEFVLWFLRVCLDQITFMADLFELDVLARRLRVYVERSEKLKPEAARLLEEALIRGEFERGDVPRITGLPERTARRVFNDVVAEGLLASSTPKGPVSLRFPVETLDILFPRLFPET